MIKEDGETYRHMDSNGDPKDFLLITKSYLVFRCLIFRLGQPATELSGGEAQRIKLATETSEENTATPSSSSMNPPPAFIFLM